MNRESQALNWVFWSAVFLIGSVLLGWMEWRSESPGALGWFIWVSIWSMVCGIGFTVVHWMLWKD